MFVLGNLFIAVGNVLDILLSAYMWVLIIAALISWVNPDPYNPIVRFLYGVTEPVLRPIRRRLGVFGGIDFSPLVAILAILFLKSFVVASLIELGYKLKGGSL
ncbi:MAG: YggT family protein [Nitrospirae bacterium]|nr:MAG: YggT family protein [Nitrospirota bacterium]